MGEITPEPPRRVPDPARTSVDALREKIRSTPRGWLRLGLFLLLTIGVFWGLFRFLELDYRLVLARLGQADRAVLAGAAAVTCFFPVLSAFRWRRVLGALGYEVSFRSCFDMIMAAWPMGTITPSKTGDFVKALYLRDRVPVPLVLGSVLAERSLDVLILLLLAALGSALHAQWRYAILAGGAFLAGFGAILALLRFRLPVPKKFESKVEPMLRALRLILQSPALLGSVVLYTVLNWFASIAQLVLCYQALGTPVPLLYAMGALPLAIFAGLLPVTLSGMGTRDSALIFLFLPYASHDVSLGVGLLYSLFGYWIPAVIGLPFLKRALPRS
ncbi:MAG: flippase-like domain-containing protein [Candidatus Eisenbacteria bacterium]|nr:flippase-like domain-containing protein [Candidatus Eisenbacteria bacterium]